MAAVVEELGQLATSAARCNLFGAQAYGPQGALFIHHHAQTVCCAAPGGTRVLTAAPPHAVCAGWVPAGWGGAHGGRDRVWVLERNGTLHLGVLGETLQPVECAPRPRVDGATAAVWAREDDALAVLHAHGCAVLRGWPLQHVADIRGSFVSAAWGDRAAPGLFLLSATTLVRATLTSGGTAQTRDLSLADARGMVALGGGMLAVVCEVSQTRLLTQGADMFDLEASTDRVLLARCDLAPHLATIQLIQATAGLTYKLI